MNTVYIDVLIGLNIFINYYILLAVSKITRVASNKKRFVFSSVLAGVFSLVIFLPELNLVLSFLMKVFITAVLIFSAFKITCLREAAILSTAYFGISFLYAGTMFFLWLCTSYEGIIINNSVVYLDISPAVFVLSVVITYVVITLIKRLFGFEVKDKKIVSLLLKMKGNSVEVNCLYDTGNFLTDVFSDHPVVVVDEALSILLSGAGLADLKHPERLNLDLEIRVIPCNTVSKSGVLYGYKVDCAHIITNEREYIAGPIVAAVSETKLNDGYSAIIGDGFYKDCKEKSKCSVK